MLYRRQSLRLPEAPQSRADARLRAVADPALPNKSRKYELYAEADRATSVLDSRLGFQRGCDGQGRGPARIPELIHTHWLAPQVFRASVRLHRRKSVGITRMGKFSPAALVLRPCAPRIH